MQITNLCNSDKIKGACREHGYTQQYVADRLGLKLSTYRKKESGTVRFSDKQKVALAELLGCDAEKKLLEEFASLLGYLIAAVSICSSVLLLALTLLTHCASAIG